jgi:hypothetical protein
MPSIDKALRRESNKKNRIRKIKNTPEELKNKGNPSKLRKQKNQFEDQFYIKGEGKWLKGLKQFCILKKILI